MKEDNVILGSEAHENLIDDLVSNFEVKFTAGGATQNAIRVAQWVLKKEGTCGFIGYVGRDLFAKIMRDELKKDKVRGYYVDVDGKPTGTCAVLITSAGLFRSLVSFPGAARSVSKDSFPWQVVQQATIVYTSGFTITTGFDVVLEMAKHCKEHGKMFAFNLSACYVAATQSDKLRELLPHIDILFGNDSEIQAFAESMKWVSYR